MEGTTCGSEGGWMRVAYVNMSEPGATCPQGLSQRVFSGLTLCGRSMDRCQSTMFSTLGLNYSHVCGQARGYQYYTPDAFGQVATSNTIDGPYVDGLSITYGSNPRKHIWTYACGYREDAVHHNDIDCPCNKGASVSIPAFVGNNYYCESGTTSIQQVLHSNDPLWDGQQCDHLEVSCCSNHPNLPWFYTSLNATINEDIELRVCGDENPSNEDVPLQVIELFVR